MISCCKKYDESALREKEIPVIGHIDESSHRLPAH